MPPRFKGLPCPVRPGRPDEQARQTHLAARAQWPHTKRFAQGTSVSVGRLGVSRLMRFSAGRDLGQEPQGPRLMAPLTLPAKYIELPAPDRAT